MILLKSVGIISSTGGLLSSHGISSVSHQASGGYTVTFSEEFSSTNYVVIATPMAIAGDFHIKDAGVRTVNQTNILITSPTGGVDLHFGIAVWDVTSS